jgi:hypothetical protein
MFWKKRRQNPETGRRELYNRKTKEWEDDPDFWDITVDAIKAIDKHTKDNPRPRKTFTILCGNVAIITYEGRSLEFALSFLDEKPARTKEQEMINIFTPLLQSNPTADLSAYERTFGIKIVKVDLLKSLPPGSPPTKYIDI